MRPLGFDLGTRGWDKGWVIEGTSMVDYFRAPENETFRVWLGDALWITLVLRVTALVFLTQLLSDGPWIDLFTDGTMPLAQRMSTVLLLGLLFRPLVVPRLLTARLPMSSQLGMSRVLSSQPIGLNSLLYVTALRFCHRHGFSARIWRDLSRSRDWCGWSSAENQAGYEAVVSMQTCGLPLRSCLMTWHLNMFVLLRLLHIRDVAWHCWWVWGLVFSPQWFGRQRIAQFANMQRSPAFWKLHDRFMRQTQQVFLQSSSHTAGVVAD